MHNSSVPTLATSPAEPFSDLPHPDNALPIYLYPDTVDRMLSGSSTSSQGSSGGHSPDSFHGVSIDHTPGLERAQKLEGESPGLLFAPLAWNENQYDMQMHGSYTGPTGTCAPQDAYFFDSVASDTYGFGQTSFDTVLNYPIHAGGGITLEQEQY